MGSSVSIEFCYVLKVGGSWNIWRAATEEVRLLKDAAIALKVADGLPIPEAEQALVEEALKLALAGDRQESEGLKLCLGLLETQSPALEALNTLGDVEAAVDAANLVDAATMTMKLGSGQFLAAAGGQLSVRQRAAVEKLQILDAPALAKVLKMIQGAAISVKLLHIQKAASVALETNTRRTLGDQQAAAETLELNNEQLATDAVKLVREIVKTLKLDKEQAVLETVKELPSGWLLQGTRTPRSNSWNYPRRGTTGARPGQGRSWNVVFLLGCAPGFMHCNRQKEARSKTVRHFV